MLPTKFSATYQSIWIDHGVKPKRHQYAYVLLPGMDATATKKYADDPAVRIIKNDVDAQAVTHSALGITAVNFWKPGTVGGITVNAVCSVIVHRTSSRLMIAVSDPTQSRTRTLHTTLPIKITQTISAEKGIKVSRRARSVKLSIEVAHSAGKTFCAILAL